MKVYQPQCFVYKWIQLSTGKWYIGSRTSKKSHLHDGYICSSAEVKHMILSNKNDWIREILATGTSNEMRLLESKILIELNAMNNPMSFNKHNNNGKFFNKGGFSQTSAHREKISKALKGISRSEEYCKKMSNVKRGVPNPKLSITTKGVPKPKVSKALKGLPQPKVLCRLHDKKEMCLSHFNRWCNRQDNPEILKSIFKKLTGIPKKKDICRLHDKKEMSVGHFLRWVNNNPFPLS